MEKSELVNLVKKDVRIEWEGLTKTRIIKVEGVEREVSVPDTTAWRCFTILNLGEKRIALKSIDDPILRMRSNGDISSAPYNCIKTIKLLYPMEVLDF